jgi:hypothetical protein
MMTSDTKDDYILLIPTRNRPVSVGAKIMS